MNFITGCLKAGVILTIISPAKKAFSEDPSVDIAAGILEIGKRKSNFFFFFNRVFAKKVNFYDNNFSA